MLPTRCDSILPPKMCLGWQRSPLVNEPSSKKRIQCKCEFIGLVGSSLGFNANGAWVGRPLFVCQKPRDRVRKVV